MNGTEQVARFSATQRLEKRLDDLELVVTEGLARDILQHRDGITQDLQVFNERLRVYAEQEAERVNVALERNRLNLETAFENMRIERRARFNFEQMPFWQRLRWVVGL